jgi:hypothetical protein
MRGLKIAALVLALFSSAPASAAWTHRSDGALGNTDNAAPASPAGVTVGDVVLIMTWDVSGTGRTLSTPSGWTQLYFSNSAGEDGYVFCRVWQMGDAMPTINWGYGDQVNMQAAAFSGPTAPVCSTMVHNSNTGGSGGTTWIGGSLTITQPNTLVIESNVKLNGCDGTGTNFGTITAPSSVPTSMGTRTGSGAFTVMASNSYTIETTAANITSANVTISGTQEACYAQWMLLSLLDQETGSPAPTFSVAPSYNTTSNTVITASFTANAASETYYCGLWLPGATPPTATEIGAGTNAHSLIANGTTTGSSESHAITATDSPTLPKYDPYCILSNGVFSTVPTTTTTATAAPTGYQYLTLASVTATGSIPKAFNDADLITLDYDTQTANFTVGSVVVSSTSGAWGYILADSDSGASGTLTIDKRSGTFADNDVLYDQGGAAALVNGSESAYTSIATSDILVRPTTLAPSNVSLGVDTSGQYTYTATGRQNALNTLIYHAATTAYLSLDIDAWFNNSAPLGGPPILTQNTVFKNGTAVDFPANLYFQDADDDTLTYARVTALPHGLSFDPTTGHLTGTPDVDAATTVTFVGYDQAFDYGTQDITFTVQTNFAAPDCTSTLTFAQNCAQSVVANTFGSVGVSQSYQCSASIASGYVISQTPAAGGDMAPGSTFSIVASSGNVCSVRSPDCTSLPTTTSDCQQLYTSAFSGLVTFAGTAKCNNTVASGNVIATSPKAHTQMPYNPNISITASLGTCSTSTSPMVNCIAHTTVECNALVGNQFGSSVIMSAVPASCPAGYATGDIYSQSPTPGKKTHTPATLNVNYCQ